jgi:hypothetical protein
MRSGVTLGELGADPFYGPDTISFSRFRFPCIEHEEKCDGEDDHR